MMCHRVRADVHAGGDLAVVQSLGDEVRDGLLGAGQASPPGDRPGGGCGPVALADPQPAQPAPDPGLVAVGAGLAVSVERILEVTDRLIPVALIPVALIPVALIPVALIPVALPAVQHAEV